MRDDKSQEKSVEGDDELEVEDAPEYDHSSDVDEDEPTDNVSNYMTTAVT